MDELNFISRTCADLRATDNMLLCITFGDVRGTLCKDVQAV